MMVCCRGVLLVLAFCVNTQIGGSERPRIISPTRYSSYADGDGVVSLECKAEGFPVPRYTWYREGEKLTDDAYTSTDPENGTLTISTFSRREEGNYTCMAENQEGLDVSPVVTLYLARISGDWKEEDKEVTVTARPGEALALECRNPPLSLPPGIFGWKKGGDDVKPSERIYIDSKETLHLIYTEVEDTGLYKCTIYNSKLDIIKLGSPVYVTVSRGENSGQTEPKLLYKTEDTVAVLGQELKLECVFSGSPVPAVTWTGQLTSSDRKLVISRVTESDGGEYTCRGENVVGQKAARIRVTLTSGPMWEEAPRDVVVVQGEDAHFTCRATSYSPSPLVLTWHMGDGTIINSTRMRVEDKDTRLVVHNVSMGDRDCVQCLISNNIDYISKIACLRVVNESSQLPTTTTSSTAWTSTHVSTESADRVSSSSSTGLTVTLAIVLVLAAAAAVVAGVVFWRMRRRRAERSGVVLRVKSSDENFAEKAKRRQTV